MGLLNPFKFGSPDKKKVSEIRKPDKENEKEKVNPERVIKDALRIMDRIKHDKDEVGMKRWKNKLNEYGLSGTFEDIYKALD